MSESAPALHGPQAFAQRNWKWLLPLSLLLGTCAYVCTPHEYDVTDRFQSLTKTRWCTTEDQFIVPFTDTGKLHLEVGGNSSDVPNSVADYKAHPNDWFNLPQYAATYQSGMVHHGDVRAAIPKGTEFRVTKVIKSTNPEVGVFVDAYVVFQGPAGRLGPIDSGSAQSRGVADLETVKFDAAVPCK
jgi:hypothetical protein